jgi:hypothetical protein
MKEIRLDSRVLMTRVFRQQDFAIDAKGGLGDEGDKTRQGDYNDEDISTAADFFEKKESLIDRDTLDTKGALREKKSRQVGFNIEDGNITKGTLNEFR